MKGITSQQLQDIDCHVILGNTYHLENRPGAELVAELGGLHKFINWPRGMLTDSGGFQARDQGSTPCLCLATTPRVGSRFSPLFPSFLISWLPVIP